jgi:hypothetical protein
VKPLEDVNDAFVEPPSQVSMRKSENRVTRIHVAMARDGQDSLQVCYGALGMKDRLVDALAFSEAAARLANWELEATRRAVRAAVAKSPEEGLRVARLASEARPEDIDTHRLYQWTAEQAGQWERLRSEYRARAEARPDSFAAQYLYARLLRGREGTALVEQLAQRFPNEPHALRAVTYARLRAGDWAGTVKAWEALRSLNAADAAELARAEVTALVALGKGNQALPLLSQLFTATGEQDSSLAELYAQVARSEKGMTPDTLIATLEASSRLEEGEKLWEVRARAGLPSEGAAQKPSVRFMSAVGRDPREAFKAATQVNSVELPFVGDERWALAYGEAVRTGETSVEEALSKALVLDPVRLEVFRRFVRGEPVSLEEAELDPEVRAAACFVRSRNAALPAQERQRLVEQARRDDWLKSSVSEAIASWAP